MMWFGRFLYDAMAILYATSLVLYFMDAIHPRRRMNRTALLLLFFVFVTETVLLVLRLRDLGYVPVYSRFDVLLLLSWLILLVALVVDAFFRVDLLLFFANALGFAIVAFDTFARQGRLSYTSNQGDLLVFHISLAVLSYVAFSFAFIFSVMYLIQNRFLREKRWTTLYFRLPSLERLDTYGYRSILVGFPLLMLAMILGAIWGKLTLGKFLLADPKPLATGLLWVMYGVYLVLRVYRGWSGQRLIVYQLICFLGVLLNFVVIGQFSVFHHNN